MVSAIIGPVIVRLSACWYLAFELELGLIGIWLGSSLDWLVRTGFMWFRTSQGHWLRLPQNNTEVKGARPEDA